MQLTLTLGILLAAGVVGDALARVVRLPKVTFYIVLGLLLSPSVFGLVPEEHLHELDPVLKLALALVLLDIGSRFTLAGIGSVLRRVWALSLGELCGAFLLVSLGVWLVGENLDTALLLGVLALATAPATTVLVLREYDSEGPVTSAAYAMVALNNLAAIVVFELLFAGLLLLESGAGAGPGRMLWLLVDLGGATAVGAAGGVTLAFLGRRLSDSALDAGLFAVVVCVLGVCEVMQMPYLLAFLVVGVVFATRGREPLRVVARMDQVATLLYVVFFVAAGAELHVGALLAAGLTGAAYIVLRCLGKYLGVFVAAAARGDSPEMRRWLGLMLLAQAGAAIGLARVARDRAPELGEELTAIIVGTVVFFELVGPVVTVFAAIHAGEVPLAHVVDPAHPRLRARLQGLAAGVRRLIGGETTFESSARPATVKSLMRRNVTALSASDNFLKVLESIETSRHQVFPVVGEGGRLLGVIRYQEIQAALFDPAVSNLVLAEDLVSPADHVLLPDQPLEEALQPFRQTTDDAVPVVASHESRKLVGVVERRDAVRYIKKRTASTISKKL